MKKLKNTYKFYIGWIMAMIYTSFVNHREMFGSNPIISHIVLIAICSIIMLIGTWIADKICEK